MSSLVPLPPIEQSQLFNGNSVISHLLEQLIYLTLFLSCLCFLKHLFYRREKRQIFILEFQKQNICRCSPVQQVELNSSLAGHPNPPIPTPWGSDTYRLAFKEQSGERKYWSFYSYARNLANAT